MLYLKNVLLLMKQYFINIHKEYQKVQRESFAFPLFLLQPTEKIVRW